MHALRERPILTKKSQKHESITHSPTWIQEMLAHLKIYVADFGTTWLFEHESVFPQAQSTPL